MICEKCHRRYGKEGVDFWSAETGICRICKEEV
jgi:hypothetical protein